LNLRIVVLSTTTLDTRFLLNCHEALGGCFRSLLYSTVTKNAVKMRYGQKFKGGKMQEWKMPE